MAHSTETPTGLAQLMTLSQVTVCQQSHTKYAIIAGDSQQQLMRAKAGQTYTRRRLADFHIDVFDTQDRTVFHLRRSCGFCSDKMEVTVGGRLACVVRNKSSLTTASLLVNDSHDKPVLKIKSSSNDICADTDFNIFGMDMQQIGVITKRWEGLMREMFTNKDQFHVRFPPDLDLDYKCALIGTCFYLDFLYYEH